MSRGWNISKNKQIKGKFTDIKAGPHSQPEVFIKNNPVRKSQLHYAPIHGFKIQHNVHQPAAMMMYQASMHMRTNYNQWDVMVTPGISPAVSLHIFNPFVC